MLMHYKIIKEACEFLILPARMFVYIPVNILVMYGRITGFNQ